MINWCVRCITSQEPQAAEGCQGPRGDRLAHAGGRRAIILSADKVDAELGLLLRFLLYTGVRLSEALRLEWDSLYFNDEDAWMRRSKGGPAGAIRLRKDLCAALGEHRESSAGRVAPSASIRAAT